MADVREVRLPEGWQALSIESSRDGRLLVADVPKSCFSSEGFAKLGARPQVEGVVKGDEVVTVNGVAPIELLSHIGKFGNPLNACAQASPAHRVGDVGKHDARPPCASCDFMRRHSKEGLAVALALWIRAVKQSIPVVLGVRSQASESEEDARIGAPSGSSQKRMVRGGRVVTLTSRSHATKLAKLAKQTPQSRLLGRKAVKLVKPTPPPLPKTERYSEPRFKAADEENQDTLGNVEEPGFYHKLLKWDPENILGTRIARVANRAVAKRSAKAVGTTEGTNRKGACIRRPVVKASAKGVLKPGAPTLGRALLKLPASMAPAPMRRGESALNHAVSAARGSVVKGLLTTRRTVPRGDVAKDTLAMRRAAAGLRPRRSVSETQEAESSSEMPSSGESETQDVYPAAPLWEVLARDRPAASESYVRPKLAPRSGQGKRAATPLALQGSRADGRDASLRTPRSFASSPEGPADSGSEASQGSHVDGRGASLSTPRSFASSPEGPADSGSEASPRRRAKLRPGRAVPRLRHAQSDERCATPRLRPRRAQ